MLAWQDAILHHLLEKYCKATECVSIYSKHHAWSRISIQAATKISKLAFGYAHTILQLPLMMQLFGIRSRPALKIIGVLPNRSLYDINGLMVLNAEMVSAERIVSAETFDIFFLAWVHMTMDIDDVL